jgi:hypothetical protein
MYIANYVNEINDGQLNLYIAYVYKKSFINSKSFVGQDYWEEEVRKNSTNVTFSLNGKQLKHTLFYHSEKKAMVS